MPGIRADRRHDQILDQIENTGNEQLDIASVVDTVDGHAGVNIPASFPSSVAAGTTVTRTYAYTVLA